jgi:hypothetical protein
MWRISDAELDRMLDYVLRERPLMSLRHKILLDLSAEGPRVHLEISLDQDKPNALLSSLRIEQK